MRAFGSGSGTESDPYQIANVTDLQQLATDVNGGTNYSGTYFKLAANINLDGVNFTPIGNLRNVFMGSFDGGKTYDAQGNCTETYTISNLTISVTSNYVGLFGAVGNGVTIQNVTLTNVNVSGRSTVGGLVGMNDGTVSDNFYHSNKGDVGGGGGTVSGNKFYSNAGDVGLNYGTVKNNTRVYKITLPDGVTAEGDSVRIVDNVTYATDSVTLKATDSDAVIKSTNYTNNADGTVSFTPTADTSISSNDIAFYYKLTLQGVTVDSGTGYGGNYSDYYTGTVTLAAKTGYNLSQTSLTVTQADTITASFDTTNHYVLADDTTTLATADNTTDYPDLIQVYELSLTEGVTATAASTDDLVVTIDGKTYAAGNVTLSATTTDYTILSVTVNGNEYDGTTLNVTADTTVSAELGSFDALVFNQPHTAVTVNVAAYDLSIFDGLYSITAARENSTLTGTDKNNTFFIASGGENILTGGLGNDTYKFGKGGGIVTDFGIGATKSGDGKALEVAPGSDVVKVSGNVTGVYFDRDASNKKSATFTAVVTYDSNDVAGEDTQIVVLQNINKKPTKYGSNPVYRTNDVAAAATLKIWDTSGSKQAVLSTSKLKKFFRDDSELSELSETVQTQLVKLNGIGDLNLPAVDQLSQTAQATFNGGSND